MLRGAHTLRGLVGNFGTRGVEEVIRQIEKLAEHDELSEFGSLFDELQGTIDLLKTALVDYLLKLTGK